MVIAYNKLEYTSACLTSLLEHLPEGIRRELILFNHGSTDRTKEFFESVKPDKQIDVSINGAVPGMELAIYEGRYAIIISNDTILTENAIENLYRIVSGAQDIGWAVPATSSVSNNQTLNTAYGSQAELDEFAKGNNVRDTRREEQRVRLCNPITAYRTAVQAKMCKDLFTDLFCVDNVNAFPDDKCCAWFRRHGYRLILAKDAYCHHFGSVTLKAETDRNFYDKGRKNFYEKYGYDPWGTGFCWHIDLIRELACTETGTVLIAGINCGLGANQLKVKEFLKEKVGNLDVMIYTYSKEPCYLADLKSVSDRVELYRREEELFSRMQGLAFSYILMDEGICEVSESRSFALKLLRQLAPGGTLGIQFPEQDERKEAFAAELGGVTSGDWVVIKTGGECRSAPNAQ